MLTLFIITIIGGLIIGLIGFALGCYVTSKAKKVFDNKN